MAPDAAEHGKDDRLTAPPDWRFADGVLMTAYACGSATKAVELIAAIVREAEQRNHHPDLDWRYDTVFVTTVSHDAGRVTVRDTELAARITALAARLQAVPQPERARRGA
jgi:4a-hydroxytetrahydrobiopterin dehydratase